MKKFNVKFSFMQSATVAIEAETEEEARREVWAAWVRDSDQWDWSYTNPPGTGTKIASIREVSMKNNKYMNVTRKK